MKYDEIENAGIEKIGRHLRHGNGKADYFPIVSADPQRGKTLRQHMKAGRVATNPLLTEAQKIAEKTALEIRKLRKRASELTPEARREFELKVHSNAIAAMEGVVTKQIEKIFNDFDERRKAWETAKTNRDYSISNDRLLRIREYELQHAFMSEEEASIAIGRMARTGFDELEAYILGAKGERAHSKMRELFEELPPYLADAEGINKLNEVKALLDLQPGQCLYRFQTEDGIVDVENKIHVADLIEREVPTPTFEEIVK